MNSPTVARRHTPTTLLRLWTLVLAVGCLHAEPTYAEAPNIVEFQGRVTVNGIPFTGTGRFRFALVDPGGPVPTIDLTPPGGGSGPILLSVDRGLYQVRVGADTSALPSSYFTDAVEPRLRVWFDDGTHGEQQLSPDLALSSVPYALSSRSAATADLAQEAAVASEAQSLSQPLPANRVSGWLTSAQIPTRMSGVRAFEGPVGIGTEAPSRSVALDVRGDLTVTPSAVGGRLSVVSPSPTAAVGYYLRDADGEDATLGLAKNRGDYSTDASPGDVVLRATSTPVSWLMLQNGSESAAVALSENRIGIGALPDAEVPLRVGGDLIVEGELSARTVRAQGALSWVSTTDTQVNMEPNRGYLAERNAGFTKFVLPATARVGDAIRIVGTGAGRWNVWKADGRSVATPLEGPAWSPRDSARNWRAVASSADGLRLAACVDGGRVYTSADSGETWTERESTRSWISIASSADGLRLVACAYADRIYTSADGGGTWFPRENARKWRSVAASSDGLRLVACVEGGAIYTSADAGLSWSSREANRNWYGVASSADGQRLAACVYGGRIYVSSDAGQSWTPRDSDRTWYSVASSADGLRLVAGCAGAARLFTSSDAGVTWTPRENARNWSSVASSADGLRLAACVFNGNGQIFTSQDAGVSWSPQDRPRFWRCVASSADGTRLIAGADKLYLSPRVDRTQGDVTELVFSAAGEWVAAPLVSLRPNGQVDPAQLPYRFREAFWLDGRIGIAKRPDDLYQLDRLSLSGNLKVDGTVYGTVFSPSDARLKTDLAPVSDSLARVGSLQGVRFAWKSVEGRPAPSSQPQVGFLAQEVAKVLPELVHTNVGGYLSVDYSGVNAVLVEAIRELSCRRERQRAELRELTREREAEQRLIREIQRRFDRLGRSSEPPPETTEAFGH